MSETASKIDQFRAQAQSDPNNEIAHFSLGKALLDAGDAAEAAKSLQRVIALNPNISKAYQLLADAQLKTGHRDYAIQTLTEGVNVSHRRGDMMPKNDMIAALEKLGAPVPKFNEAKDTPVGEGQVFCKRHNAPGPRMEKPPFRNAFGQLVYENTCATCWKEAIAFGTKVINELRLPLSDPKAQEMWDKHIRDFLNLQ